MPRYLMTHAERPHLADRVDYSAAGCASSCEKTIGRPGLGVLVAPARPSWRSTASTSVRPHAYVGLLLAALLAGCGARTVVETVTANTTRSGGTLWQFEALLHDTFGNRPVCASGRWRQNFTAGHCTPLATFAPYGYVFAGAHRSRFHVTSTRARDFGNYPQPVLIRGRNIACDPRERTFLVEYVEAVPLTLGCSRAGWTSR
jgi:hypothetical protein